MNTGLCSVEVEIHDVRTHEVTYKRALPQARLVLDTDGVVVNLTVESKLRTIKIDVSF